MPAAPSPAADEITDVLRLRDLESGVLDRFVDRLGIQLRVVADGASIPASYWGEPEAGIAGQTVWVRADTPVHSLLHEVGHALCAKAARGETFSKEANSDDLEECAVCYLQVFLATQLPPMDRARMWSDMDSWGYSFREGGAREWFFGDGEDGCRWLVERGLLPEQDLF